MNLFTAPTTEDRVESCYWTALNFSRSTPDDRFLVSYSGTGEEIDVIETELRRNYVRIDQPSRPGDIIAYYVKSVSRGPAHLCTYLAADMVFTKNGVGYESPWCIVKRAETDNLYLAPKDGEARYYRAKIADQ